MALTVTPSTYYAHRKQQGKLNVVLDSIKAALMRSDFNFDRNKNKVWTAPTWQANTFYSGEDMVRPTDTLLDRIFTISGEISGQSGSGEPDWATDFGSITPDGDLEWISWSRDTKSGEISDSGGYAQIELSVTDYSMDEENNISRVDFDSITFIPPSGEFDECDNCILYDDTDNRKTVIADIDFHTGIIVVERLELRGLSIESVTKQTMRSQ